MIPSPHNFFSAARSVSLSTSDRERIRRRLTEFMAGHPLSTSAPWWRTLRWAVGGACAIILMVTAGLAAAANGSIPGDTLYPIKVGLTEPLRGAVALTPSAKAETSVELLHHRLTEAETVVERQGALSAAQEDMEERVNAAAAAVKRQVDGLERRQLSSATKQVKDHISDCLQKHQQSLKQKVKEHPTQRQAAERLLKNVDEQEKLLLERQDDRPKNEPAAVKSDSAQTSSGRSNDDSGNKD